MKRQLELLMKLLPSAYRFRISIIGMSIMYLLGIAMALVFPGEGLGVLFLMMGPIWLSQLMISLTVSNMVQMSPLKKALHTHLLAIVTFISSGLSYLLVIILDKINRYIYPSYTDGESICQYLTCCFIVVLFTLYISFCYKYFLLSNIVLFIGVEAVTMLNSFVPFIPAHAVMPDIPPLLAALLGFAAICLSALAQYGITCLLYKKPLSKTSQYAGLRKQM